MPINERARRNVLAELRRKGTLTPLVEEYVGTQGIGTEIPAPDLPAEAAGDEIGAYLDALDQRKKRLRVNQTVRAVRRNDPAVAEYFDPGMGIHPEEFRGQTLKPADGTGRNPEAGYVYHRPGEKDFVEKYVPPGERIIEQIRLGEDERLETAYTSGRTGEPLKRKPKRLPR